MHLFQRRCTFSEEAARENLGHALHQASCAYGFPCVDSLNAMLSDLGKANRKAARDHGAIPVIPHKANEKDKPAFFAKAPYKGRARVAQAVGKIKRFKRIAPTLREDKAKLRCICRSRSRLHLAQIRPHRLGAAMIGDLTSAEVLDHLGTTKLPPIMAN